MDTVAVSKEKAEHGGQSLLQNLQDIENSFDGVIDFGKPGTISGLCKACFSYFKKNLTLCRDLPKDSARISSLSAVLSTRKVGNCSIEYKK